VVMLESFFIESVQATVKIIATCQTIKQNYRLYKAISLVCVQRFTEAHSRISRGCKRGFAFQACSA
ncbi:hypothetical protein, partial [uncultured Desulfovibrio sp.]|uniref:hypothetical protein n=1 Tax=uncultured Desulfovibrio sp. TaxID=167968 RepID=UPI00266FA629